MVCSPVRLPSLLPWQQAVLLNVTEPERRWAFVCSLDELPPAAAVRPRWAR